MSTIINTAWSCFKNFPEYLDNELDEIICKDIEKHIKECVPCFVCLQTLKRTVDSVQTDGKQTGPQRLLKKIKRSHPKYAQNPTCRIN